MAKEKLPLTLRIMTPGPSAHLLNTTGIRLKNDMTTMVSDLSRDYQLHSELRNMRNGRNMERGGGESAIGNMHNRRQMGRR